MPRRMRRNRRAPRRNYRRGSKGGKLAVPRNMLSAPDQYSKVIETITIADATPNAVYTRIFALSNFRRASLMAGLFRWYKAAKCTYTYQPLYNTFQEGSGATVSKPQIYFAMNRCQDATAQSYNDIIAMGSRPQQFTRNKIISYVPNWCSPGLSTWVKDGSTGLVAQISQTGLKAQTDWLVCPIANSYHDNTGLQPFVDKWDQTPTSPPIPSPPIGQPQLPNYIHPANVVYNGHDDFVFQENTTNPVYMLTLTVEWHFKQPFYSEQGQGLTKPSVPELTV